jgi:hypothetical protein
VLRFRDRPLFDIVKQAASHEPSAIGGEPSAEWSFVAFQFWIADNAGKNRADG